MADLELKGKSQDDGTFLFMKALKSKGLFIAVRLFEE